MEIALPTEAGPVPDPARQDAPARSARRPLLPVEIVPFTAIHILPVAALMARAFALHDPLTRAAGIDEAEMYPWVLDIAEKAVRDGFSLVALEQGRVVGCIVSEPADDFIEPTRPLCAKFDPVFALVERLHHPFLSEARQRHPLARIAHCTDIAVAPDCMGRAVAAQLYLANDLYLHRLGYRWVYGEFSNAENYRAVQSRPHEVLARIDLPSFEYQGRRPFATAQGDAISILGPVLDPRAMRARWQQLRGSAPAGFPGSEP